MGWAVLVRPTLAEGYTLQEIPELVVPIGTGKQTHKVLNINML
jgi:hypothetical protein